MASVKPADSARPPAGLTLPRLLPTTDAGLGAALAQRLALPTQPTQALGRLQTLLLQLVRIQSTKPPAFDRLALDAPQLLVFAADHGIADAGVSAFTQADSLQRVLHLLRGQAAVNALAALHGFDLTLVDAGLAAQLSRPHDALAQVSLLSRKIGHGSRNMLLSPAMSPQQAVAALHAGMDVVRHLPGQVLALGSIGVGGSSCAALLLSRLCGVPLADASNDCTDAPAAHALAAEVQRKHKLKQLLKVARRHYHAVTAFDALAAMGGFEIAMMAGAMLQAGAERRVVLVDGFVAGAAALVAHGLCPAVCDYLVFAQRSVAPGHRLLLLHLQARPLLDLELHLGQGEGALLAWPLLQAAQRLLAQQTPAG
ncbi:MAG: nicotinate-nucleotide--dimethylbenzimidazole phosphoribosyltransferase [Hydrogenophaga sp.]|nr:nicotinate-nucleotide--dimethylbenzimidazole phosphoribosyltransferase [Hydrogenophaga sp.]